MKTPLAISLMAVALAVAPAASAYHLSPPDTSSKLRGRMTFYPNDGAGKPFRCKVTFFLKTKGFIKSASVNSGGGICTNMVFSQLPWRIGIINATSGEFGPISFISGAGDCSQGVVTFEDNSSGIWTLPPESGACVSGTLTSTPPVTIVP